MEGQNKSLFQLFVPLCLETIFYMLSGMVDTLMLSSVGDQAVGAVGTANTYIGVFIIMYSVVSMGMLAVMTQNIGAYMPISNFGAGLQKVLSYLPSTYATSLIKNHMLHGVFVEMERKHYPGEMVDAIKGTLDCNPVFHENVVSVNQMIGIMLGSIAVFGIIYYIVTVSSDR